MIDKETLVTDIKKEIVKEELPSDKSTPTETEETPKEEEIDQNTPEDKNVKGDILEEITFHGIERKKITDQGMPGVEYILLADLPDLGDKSKTKKRWGLELVYPKAIASVLGVETSKPIHSYSFQQFKFGNEDHKIPFTHINSNLTDQDYETLLSQKNGIRVRVYYGEKVFATFKLKK
jgi:hypothetical protein